MISGHNSEHLQAHSFSISDPQGIWFKHPQKDVIGTRGVKEGCKGRKMSTYGPMQDDFINANDMAPGPEVERE